MRAEAVPTAGRVPSATIVVDLGFGDSGKGRVVDALAARLGARWVVRFNGGCQAGHNVVTPDGKHHTFAQFGAATFQAGVGTYLSRFMAWNPLAMAVEARHLASLGVTDALSRVIVDRHAPITTIYHHATNRLRERLRGDGRHGSCGVGYGETVRDQLERPEVSLTAGDLDVPGRLRRKLHGLRDAHRADLEDVRPALLALPDAADDLALLDDPHVLDRVFDGVRAVRASVQLADERQARERLTGPLVLEGAQGVLLDEHAGFHPYTTWSTTTFGSAEHVLDDLRFRGPRLRLGVTRTYCTRHGAGPMPSEDPALALDEPHNLRHDWQGAFRQGPLDLVLLRYALAACGHVDQLAVTHLDRLPHLPPLAVTAYDLPEGRLGRLPAPGDLAAQERLGQRLFGARPVSTPWPTTRPEEFLDALSGALGVPVGVEAHGPSRDATVFH